MMEETEINVRCPQCGMSQWFPALMDTQATYLFTEEDTCRNCDHPLTEEDVN